MRILLLSINHRTADLATRERLALSSDRLEDAINAFRSAYPFAEIAVLCTCNRTELYIARPVHDAPDVDDVRAFLAEHCRVDVAQLTAASIARQQDQAIAHLFRVACGLESMVLGEAQILGQVKRGYEQANRLNAVGPVLHRVFQDAAAAAKLARRQSGIDTGRLSVGSVAVQLARQVFDHFADKTIVGVGAGEMGKLALQHMAELSPTKLWLTNRSADRAADVADALQLSPDRGGVRPWDDLDALLVEADVLVTSTGADEPIIDAARFQPLLRKRRSRPLLIIDLAVPRDVATDVAALSNIFLYNVDDLQQGIDKTHEQRQAATDACEQIIHERVRACMWDIQHRDVGHLIRELRKRLLAIGEQESQRTAARLAAEPTADADVRQLLDEHTHRLINKILHMPLSKLDRRNVDAPLGFYAAALRRLFNLDAVPPADAGNNAAPQYDDADDRADDASSSSDAEPSDPLRTVRVGDQPSQR